MTAQEAAFRLNKSVRWVRFQCAAGEIEASFFGGSYSISDESLANFLKATTVTAKASTSRRRPRRLP